VKNRKPKVSIIIPNYNRKDHLERLLPSIADQTFDDYEVTIIDDFSPDREAVEYIKTFIKTHKNMHLVENPENLGFVKTCNKGFSLATGEFICLLTNDTDVTRDFVEKNVRIMEANRSIGVLSCIISDEKGNIWSSGGRLDKGWLEMNRRDDFEGIRPADFAPGTACFYRKDVLDKVGLLNEYFVMYHEDVDFCLRVKHQTDYRICMFSDKLVAHYVQERGLWSKQKCYYLFRNLLLALKQHSPNAIPRILASYLKVMATFGYLFLRMRDPGYLLLTPYIIKGTVHGLIKKPADPPRRQSTNSGDLAWHLRLHDQ